MTPDTLRTQVQALFDANRITCRRPDTATEVIKDGEDPGWAPDFILTSDDTVIAVAVPGEDGSMDLLRTRAAAWTGEFGILVTPLDTRGLAYLRWVGSDPSAVLD